MRRCATRGTNVRRLLEQDLDMLPLIKDRGPGPEVVCSRVALCKSRCLSVSGGHHGSGHHPDGPIYLDYSATTSVDPRAAESTQPIPDHAFWIGHKSDIAA